MGQVKAKAGPIEAKVNPNLNTSTSFTKDQASVKILGFGLSLGSKTGVSTPLGSLGLNFNKKKKSDTEV